MNTENKYKDFLYWMKVQGYYVLENVITPKLLKELRPGTRIVTFVYQIDLPLIAKDEKNEVYVYEIPNKKQEARIKK